MTSTKLLSLDLLEIKNNTNEVLKLKNTDEELSLSLAKMHLDRHAATQSENEHLCQVTEFISKSLKIIGALHSK